MNFAVRVYAGRKLPKPERPALPQLAIPEHGLRNGKELKARSRYVLLVEIVEYHARPSESVSLWRKLYEFYQLDMAMIDEQLKSIYACGR